MGEKDYNGISASIVNTCTGYLVALNTDAWPSSATAYAVGWNLHSRQANFLFKDGHVSAYKFTGTNIFDKDYLPR